MSTCRGALKCKVRIRCGLVHGIHHMVCDFEREWEVTFSFQPFGQKARSAFPNEGARHDEGENRLRFDAL